MSSALVLEFQVYCRSTLCLCPEGFELIQGPLLDFVLRLKLGVGPNFYLNNIEHEF